jgi:hypothetical protein
MVGRMKRKEEASDNSQIEKLPQNKYILFYVLLWLVPLAIMLIRGNLF